ASSALELARSHLAATGFDVQAHDLRRDDAGFGQPALAVAYPAALLQALRAWAGELGAELESVLPASVLAWQDAQRRVPSERPAASRRPSRRARRSTAPRRRACRRSMPRSAC